jgi:hypothetical protein
VDGEKWPFANWAALYAGSIPLLGLKFKVFHYATEPQRFHAAGFSLPPRHVLKFAPRMFTGKKIDDENLVESPAREMRIELAEPMAFTIDGDMLPAASQITVKSGPRLKVLVR